MIALAEQISVSEAMFANGNAQRELCPHSSRQFQQGMTKDNRAKHSCSILTAVAPYSHEDVPLQGL